MSFVFFILNYTTSYRVYTYPKMCVCKCTHTVWAMKKNKIHSILLFCHFSLSIFDLTYILPY